MLDGPLLPDTVSGPVDALANRPRGWTPRELARLLRVRVERVRGWIQDGSLKAINTAAAKCGKPRYVVLPHHLAEFERQHAAAAPKEGPRRRRRKATKDYYPDILDS
jgi:hypothetical protein